MGGEPLCPDPEVWQLGLISLLPDRIILHLETLREAVPCPDCGARSSRIHSRYQRKPWDLPWSSWPVQLVVHARKFFCDSAQCLRRILTEPFPGVLAPYARQTQRLSSALLELVHASNAESAARVSGLLGYVTSPDTLIRRQRQEQFPVLAPQALGVDEFALRRGCTYGTILVDLERHQPVDVLEGKQAGPLAQWLQDHSGVDILARYRAGAYALAGRTGAPGALQVADRFHLVHNVGDALKELLRSRQWEIPTPQTGDAVAVPVPSAMPVELTPHLKGPVPTPKKLALWEEIQKRKGSGQSNRAMAQELGGHRKTIRKYLTATQPPAYGPRPGRRPKLAPYLPYLRQRWEDGCHNARKLYGELLVRGYNGAETSVKDAVRPWRCKSPPPLPRNRSSSALYWLVLRPFSQLSDADRQELEQVIEANPVLAKGHHLKESFRHIMSQRDVEGLDAWIEEAAESRVPPFQSLAKSFRQDYDAIRLAFTTPWSTGQCEGQICRVKLIKRLGYGRAKVYLLRQRVLHRFAA